MNQTDLDARSDEELILMFQQNVQRAYDVLVSRYKDPLMNYIFRFVGDMDSAADILQETFIRVYQKKDLYKTIAKFSTWVYTIAGNLAKSDLRSSRRKYTTSISQEMDDDSEYDLPLPDSDPMPDRAADSALLGERIQEALLQLPDVFREAVILRDVQDLTYEEIAEITKQPIGTVKSRINRGRSQLQELLKDYYD